MSRPIATDLKVFTPTRDFNESLQFYTTLGWQLNWQDAGLAEIELAGTRLYLQNYYTKEWAENFMIYVSVDDAQAWYDHVHTILQKGEFISARVEPPKKESYGAIVTYMWDPCGILVHFAQQV
ncbi:MAG: VOC family protein [Chloroflexota bacterium]